MHGHVHLLDLPNCLRLPTMLQTRHARLLRRPVELAGLGPYLVWIYQYRGVKVYAGYYEYSNVVADGYSHFHDAG